MTRIPKALQRVDAAEYWGCARKRKYGSKAKAKHKAYKVYRCGFCRQWHRSSRK